MYKGPTNFDPQKVSLSNLPLVVNSDAETLVSLTTVTKRWDSVVDDNLQVRKFPSQTLFYLFNADLNFRFTESDLGGSINIPHMAARDRENGAAYIAYLELDNVIAESVYGNEHVYRAYLRNMNVYSVKEDNPFNGLVNTYSEDIAPESGYPYLPPATYIKERRFPLQVTIETVYLPHQELKKTLERIHKQLDESRIKY